MKYINAKDVLPKELIEQLQDYVQGSYVYVPKREDEIKVSDRKSEYRIELEKRNEHIYLKHLQKWSHEQIAKLYHLSLPSIRRIIFEQRKSAGVLENMIKQVLTCWNFTEENQITQCHNHVWEIDSKYMIKVYDSEDTLQRNLAILKVLQLHNVPVSTIYTTKDNRDYVEDNGKYYVVTQKVTGEHLRNIRNEKLVYQMGVALGQLHIALAQCEKQIEFWDNSLMDEMHGWIKEKFVQNRWDMVCENDFVNTCNQLEKLYDELPKQLIHRDVHSGNFLFENDEFSGYIDFDLSQKNIRIFDIGYFLAGLLTEENGTFMKEYEWLLVCKQVVKGYDSKNKLEDVEKQALSYVMECIELLFAAYFISVDDTRCALDAIKVYQYVRGLKEKIYRAVK